MKLSFELCSFVALVALTALVAIAEPGSYPSCPRADQVVTGDLKCAPAPPSGDAQGDRARELHKELAAPRVQAAIASAVPPTTAGKSFTIPGAEKPAVFDTGKPITFRVKPESWTTTTRSTILMMAKPCTGGITNDVSFVVYDGNSQPIVSINECTGKVTVAHPEKMDDQARAFWRTLQRAWPEVCRVDAAKGNAAKADLK